MEQAHGQTRTRDSNTGLHIYHIPVLVPYSDGGRFLVRTRAFRIHELLH